MFITDTYTPVDTLLPINCCMLHYVSIHMNVCLNVSALTLMFLPCTWCITMKDSPRHPSCGQQRFDHSILTACWLVCSLQSCWKFHQVIMLQFKHELQLAQATDHCYYHCICSLSNTLLAQGLSLSSWKRRNILMLLWTCVCRQSFPCTIRNAKQARESLVQTLDWILQELYETPVTLHLLTF